MFSRDSTQRKGCQLCLEIFLIETVVNSAYQGYTEFSLNWISHVMQAGINV